LMCTVTLRNFVPDPASVKTAATAPATTNPTTTVAKTTTAQNPKPAAPKTVTQTKKDTLKP
jgi:hypothetical protein